MNIQISRRVQRTLGILLLTALAFKSITWSSRAAGPADHLLVPEMHPILLEPEVHDPDEGLAVNFASAAGSTATLPSVIRDCPIYLEFRNLDFLQPALRRRLCRNAEAYKLYPDDRGYPLCQLPNPFDSDLLNVVKEGSDVVELWVTRTLTLPVYIYSGNDLISNTIRAHHAWEPELVHWTLRFAMKLPDVTFLDMGSNIGVYSLQAAKLGLPVVALDANIRNLLRLRLSLDAASLDAALVWNFIAADRSLKYLSFLADCNVGGAGRDLADLPDTVPVMPLRSERVRDLVRTRTVVMKIDIQGGETDFLLTSGRLFTELSVAAVQMEWFPPMIRGNDSLVMRTFFSARGYQVWQMPGFKRLDPANESDWETFKDVFWVHPKYVKLVRTAGSVEPIERGPPLAGVLE